MFDPNKSPTTLPEMIKRSFASFSARPCLGIIAPGATEYQYSSYGNAEKRVRDLAGGLLFLGIRRGDRVALLAENCPEWALCDLASQMIGAITVPLFSTLPVEQVEYIIDDSAPRLIFVSDATQCEKAKQVQANNERLEVIVAFDKAASDEKVLSLADLEISGETYLEENPGLYESTWPAAAAEDVATLIYTSGTTGRPKGVQLTHRNLISNVEAVAKIPVFSNDEVFLSFLPLAHIYERSMGFYLPIWLGGAIAYCENLFTVDKNLREAKPTIMLAVPRFYDMVISKLFGKIKSLPEDKREKFMEALALAIKTGAAKGGRLDAEKIGLADKAKHLLFDRAVYQKIRQNFGGRVKFFVTGGAPLPPDTASLFWGIGIPLLEGYGLTETSPLISVNLPQNSQIGSVGPVLGNVEVRIAEDGEVLARGNSIFTGYWNNAKETYKALDQEGWFHTGDLGKLENGFLKITGRKKDIIVLANGKNVAPAPIEFNFSQSTFISQIILLGDNMKGVGAFIVPDFEILHDWAKENNLVYENDGQLIHLPEVQKLYKDELDSRSGALADFEKIKQIVLLEYPFTIENDEMTPTLKLKRHIIAKRYKQMLRL
jgi:long-chain acyl-CoA synthetase